MKKAKDLIIGCEHDGSYIPVNEVLKLIKLAQIDAIEETCKVCAEEAKLCWKNESHPKGYPYFAWNPTGLEKYGDKAIHVNRQSILSVADKLKKEL